VGVDLVIYIHRDDLPKLLEIENSIMIWDELLFLLDKQVRWDDFKKEFEIIEGLGFDSKEFLKHLASLNKKIKDREMWVDILSKYRLYFAPDTVEVGKEWVSIPKVFNAIQELVRENWKKFLEKL